MSFIWKAGFARVEIGYADVRGARHDGPGAAGDSGRAYTQAYQYVVEVIAGRLAQTGTDPGYEITEQAKFLRHFLGEAETRLRANYGK